MPTIALTNAFVKTAICLDGKGKTEYTDLDCKGLFLEVRKSGGATYYLRYTNDRGRQRQYRVGDSSAISLAQARQKSQLIKGQIAMGEDPLSLIHI